MSNILSVFNPPPAGPVRSQTDEDCLPCTAIQSAVLTLGGLYFSSVLPFKDSKTGKIDFVKHPLWWQKSVRGAGIVIFGLGIYRAGEVFSLLVNRKYF